MYHLQLRVHAFEHQEVCHISVNTEKLITQLDSFLPHQKYITQISFQDTNIHQHKGDYVKFL